MHNLHRARASIPRGRPPSALGSPPSRSLASLVQQARSGHASAWEQLVARFDKSLRSVARNYRLTPADVDDVVQATWLDLLQGIGNVRDPDAIGAWLTTTTRRKALRLLQIRTREVPTDDITIGDRADPESPEHHVLAAERCRVLADALTTLPDRQRQLMTILVAEVTPNYDCVSEMLAMPRGSIGPVRGRALARLRRHAALLALAGAPAVTASDDAIE